MRKNIQLAVPKPCDEKWSAFAKTSRGGFCSSCQKEVIDFTSWSDERLMLYFKNRNDNSCGRFRREQLKVYRDEKPTSSSFGWISVFVAGMLLLFTSRNGSAQPGNTVKQTTEQYQPEIKIGEARTTKLSIVKVNGLVRSPQDGLPLPGVNVINRATSNGTTTDVDGRFSLSFSNPESTPVLIFSFVGFKSVEYPVNVVQPEQEILIDMMYDDVVLAGEVIVVGNIHIPRWYNPKRWWWKIKSLF